MSLSTMTEVSRSSIHFSSSATTSVSSSSSSHIHRGSRKPRVKVLLGRPRVEEAKHVVVEVREEVRSKRRRRRGSEEKRKRGEDVESEEEEGTSCWSQTMVTPSRGSGDDRVWCGEERVFGSASSLSSLHSRRTRQQKRLVGNRAEEQQTSVEWEEKKQEEEGDISVERVPEEVVNENELEKRQVRFPKQTQAYAVACSRLTPLRSWRYCLLPSSSPDSNSTTSTPPPDLVQYNAKESSSCRYFDVLRLDWRHRLLKKNQLLADEVAIMPTKNNQLLADEVAIMPTKKNQLLADEVAIMPTSKSTDDL
eukprot:GHVS01014624.1.p1 GENE.GHVS01014624.1~~GHVS01014624.1.p1  ORF type:complete len:308 (-),score=85.15 GHVS01014624.1:259-1182(-)